MRSRLPGRRGPVWRKGLSSPRTGLLTDAANLSDQRSSWYLRNSLSFESLRSGLNRSVETAMAFSCPVIMRNEATSMRCASTSVTQLLN